MAFSKKPGLAGTFDLHYDVDKHDLSLLLRFENY